MKREIKIYTEKKKNSYCVQLSGTSRSSDILKLAATL